VTLHRRFAAETGTTPTEWLVRQRISVAQELLEDSGLTIAQVANRVGFATPDLLSKHVTSRVTVSPSRYRDAFGRSLQDA
jgi:transcriptional regulator GlxA family with amidase domain